MNCKKCGKEMRIGTEEVGIDERQLPIIHRFAYCDNCMEKIDLDIQPTNNKPPKPQKKKDGILSVLAVIFSIFTCTFWIGFVLAIIDLCTDKNKERKHSGSIFAIILACIWLLILLLGGGDTETEQTTEVATTQATTQTVTEQQSTEVATTEEIITETEEEYKASCEEYAYKDVLRNPEQYVGKRVKIPVMITSVHEESILNSTKYYFAYSEGEYGWYSGDYYAIFDERVDNNLKLLSDDVIYVYGEIAESEYTSSLILASEEVFAIKMKYVELLEE